jgi:DNA-binding NarL/FixJ family response regulator
VDSVTVLVVDHERAVGQAVARCLACESGFVVVGTWHTAMSAVRAATRDRPDVIVFDEAVVEGNIAQILQLFVGISAPGPRVVVTSDHEDPERAYESICAGAAAFVSRASGIDEIVDTIRDVVGGGTHLAPVVLSGVLDRFRQRAAAAGDARPTEPLAHLTTRERQVLEQLMAGLPRTEIARQLGVSVHTVRTHTQTLYAKLEVHSSVEAVSVAIRHGLLGQLPRP